MKSSRALFVALFAVVALWTIAPAVAAERETPAGAQRLELEAGGLNREALIFRPETAKGLAPLVFVFHGHGGTAAQAARSIRIHTLWPEAVVVYPQGLPTPGHLTDPEGKRNGWQRKSGDQGDRDYAFFDALLERIKKDYAIDPKRIYSTGHSNGGSFTYLLWETRRDTFAAFAPSGAVSPRVRQYKPAPALHIAGSEDPLVRFTWQQATMRMVKNLNGCATEGKSWGEHATIYASDKGAPFVEWIHPGGHEFPAGASEAIVRFFKEQK